jgi:hypothetical protein
MVYRFLALRETRETSHFFALLFDRCAEQERTYFVSRQASGGEVTTLYDYPKKRELA